MSDQVGIWIDHRKAVIVTLVNDKPKIKTLKSKVRKHVRFSAAAAGAGEDTYDRQFRNQLDSYYAKVAKLLNEAKFIHIFGPGEARIELETALEREGQKDRISLNESADKMTENQIAAKVKEYFRRKL
jgi:hypothetical protein